ncbi:MAG: glycerate kinase [Clostridiales bacterium]|nr:glycerate kinase [Clostridiales bacterium]
MKLLLMPDAFKGNLTSIQVCAHMERAVRALLPKAEVISIPIADGGEGMLDGYLAALPGQRVTLEVTGPEGAPVQACYGLFHGGELAVVEMAQAAGLSLAPGRRVETNTTYGVGELMRDAIGRGASKLLLGLGGSATNDAGCGMASALGVRFRDVQGADFLPTGGSLADIAAIDLSGLLPALADRRVQITAACDVSAPLFGPQGAAHVYARQKGADTPARRLALEQGLQQVGGQFERLRGRPVSQLPGAGAAGGMGAGVIALLGGRLVSGIDALLDTARFEQRAAGADLILTGEGRFDRQSLQGKAVVGIARRAKKLGIPVVALVGELGGGTSQAHGQGLCALFSINRRALPMEEAKRRAPQDIEAVTQQLLRLWLAAAGELV